MNPLSIIIPTYKSTEALELCLQSCIGGQSSQNEIIVVVDGTMDLNRSVLDKYKDDIEVLDLGENQGLGLIKRK